MGAAFLSWNSAASFDAIAQVNGPYYRACIDTHGEMLATKAICSLRNFSMTLQDSRGLCFRTYSSGLVSLMLSEAQLRAVSV